jgi:hypothetical protein
MNGGAAEGRERGVRELGKLACRRRDNSVGLTGKERASGERTRDKGVKTQSSTRRKW